MKLHIHWHKFVARRGVNTYYECRCGDRTVSLGKRGYSPVDQNWLNGRGWTLPPTHGPRG